MRHPLSFTMRCLILLAVLLAIPQIALAQQAGAPFQPQTQTYPFSAAASAGTAVQIAANSGGPTSYGQYLVANTGANGAWVTLAFSSALAAQTIPTGSTPGNAVWLPAGAACTYSGPSQAWFNAQTASSTTTLTVTGGTGTAGCVAQSGGGSGPTGTVTANQGTAAAAAGAWPTYQTNGSGTIIGTLANPTYVQVPAASPLPANVTQVNGVTVLTGAGAASTSERFTVGQDVTTAAGIGPTQTASGNITTQNLNPNSGTATAGSVVAVTLYNSGTCTIQVTGTYTASGGLSPQVTTDGANWVTQASASTLQNMATGATTATIPSGATGIWQIEINGNNQFRIGANGAVTGTAVTTIQCGPGTSQTSTSINSPLPGGGNTIGAVIQGSPPTSNILLGRQSFTSTTSATTLITITAGKTFTGTIGASVSCGEAAAGTAACQATAAFTTVGAGTTPAAGAVFDCDARSGANAATGAVGSQSANYCYIPISVNCSTGTCTIAVAATIAGTSGVVTATASGTQQ